MIVGHFELGICNLYKQVIQILSHHYHTNTVAINYGLMEYSLYELRAE